MGKKRRTNTPTTADLPDELAGTTTVELKSLAATHIMRIRDLTIDFDESGLVVLEGNNQQGKTSAVRALEMVIAGPDAAPPDPIHGDQEEGIIIARFTIHGADQGETGELIVKRIFRKDKPPKLTVHLEGIRRALARPQEILDILMDHIALDIMQFARMSDEERAKVLAELMGFDATEIDRKRKAAFDERTEVKRDRDRLEKEYEGITQHEDAPEKVVVLGELLEDLDKRKAHNAKGDTLKTEASTAVDNLAQAEKELAEAKLALKNAGQVVVALKQDARESVLLAEDFEYKDVSEITTKIGNAEGINAKVRENEQREKKRKAYMKAKDEADALTATIDQLDKTKREELKKAEERLPVKGLGIAEGKTTYKGKPFNEAGDSAIIVCSTAISIALNKERLLKIVTVDKAEQMDPPTRKKVKAMCRDAGCQLMMTMVVQEGGPSAGSLVIEDGAIIPA